MSRTCEICGKRANMANSISHAHNVNRKKQFPNLQIVHVIVSGNRKKVRACTQCIRSGKMYAREA